MKPATILEWYRKLVAKKFDSSKKLRGPGRPPVSPEVEQLVVRLAEENPSWGWNRIAGALLNLGYKISHTTVGKILERNGIPPAPRRKPDSTWSDFVKTHEDVLSACDFFTQRRMDETGGPKPDDGHAGVLRGQRYLIHDRDTKFCKAFRSIKLIKLPPKSPNLNAYASCYAQPQMMKQLLLQMSA